MNQPVVLCDDVWGVIKEFAGIYNISTDWEWLGYVCQHQIYPWYNSLRRKSFFVKEQLYVWIKVFVGNVRDLPLADLMTIGIKWGNADHWLVHRNYAL